LGFLNLIKKIYLYIFLKKKKKKKKKNNGESTAAPQAGRELHML